MCIRDSGNILPSYKALYDKYREFSLVYSYTNDVFFNGGAEAAGFARNMISLAGLYENNADEANINVIKDELANGARGFFKNYNQATDKKLFVAVMTLYGENLDPKWQAPEYIRIKSCLLYTSPSPRDRTR